MKKLIAVVALAAIYWAIAVRAPFGPRSMRSFDPDRVADLEVGMWQAYYAKEKIRLFRLLVTMLREQYHYSWQTAVRAAFYLARAAATFGDATGDYDRVLPDLEAGYTIARDWTGAGFDPAAVARAELSWWTARRDPASGRGAQKNAVVAARMTDLYTLLYEVPRARVAEAAQLRVEAADLRDRDARAPDWNGVSYLLHQSYRSLHLGVAAPEQWGPLHRRIASVQTLLSEVGQLAVGAALAIAAPMDDVDATDRVVVIVHTASADDDRDDEPTTPVLIDDHTTRQRCEFEEDTVEEYFV